MDFLGHPGNLGATRRGTLLTIHHADWPTYPEGDDFYTPLLQLTVFPPGTEFLVISDIDQSYLFAADVEGKSLDDPYNEKHYHVAIWYEDLRELLQRDMIDVGYIGKDGEFVSIEDQILRNTTMGPAGISSPGAPGFGSPIMDAARSSQNSVKSGPT
jgi:hypothetical protein